ncbi:MAG: LuxR C-terminal-related transcriptional regulator [Chloroflexota bacterium]
MSVATVQANPVLLLQTKLYRPQIPSGLVQRPHLINYLNHGLRSKLTLVAAPAGYGKTTIVTQWLHAQQPHLNQIAWLSLDESDDNLLHFVHYLVAAIQQQQPASCTNVLASLHAPQPMPWSHLVVLLVNDLTELRQSLILVLDDYHFVTEGTIHEFLDRLLEHLPPTLHLVLISRTEPPLSLPRLRVRRQMNELRTADLSFSNSETERYLTQDSSKSVAANTISALQERSQGWIAGLYLAKLSLAQKSNEQSLLQQLQANNSHIMDYLITEVLSQQPQAIQTFLLHTSILRRFSRPLCESLLANTWPKGFEEDGSFTGNSQAPMQNIIDWLDRQHLFTIALDDNRIWYRYHHFFQLMLTRRLQKQTTRDQLNSLHWKASRWFAKAGLVDEALYHALATADTTFAVQLIKQHRLALLNQFDYRTLERWLALLPEGVIEQYPQLILLDCWVALSTYRLPLQSVLQKMQQLETRLSNREFTLGKAEQTVVQAEIAAVNAVCRFWIDDFEQWEHHSQQALADLPASYLFMRTYVASPTALGLQASGKTDEAIRIAEKELQNEASQYRLPLIWLRGYLATLYYLAGRLQQVVRTTRNSIRQLEDEVGSAKVHIAGATYRWLATVQYEWNDLATARHYFLKADETNTLAYANCQLLLAWSYEVTGQAEKASEILENFRQWALLRENQLIHRMLASFQARRLYWQGKIEMALEVINKVAITKVAFNFMAEVPAFTKIKILIAHDQEDSWHEANEWLEALWPAFEKSQNIPGQIEILALTALLHQRRGQLDKAFSTLERALKLAQPSNFIRTFVDLGRPLASLLYQLLEQGIEPEYVGQLLAAFPQTQQNNRPAQSAQEAAQPQLIEPLTRRETEVLLLLAEELPNKQIAQKLSISPLTVKRHTINIYQKLSVSSRHDAVQAARALGIVT